MATSANSRSSLLCSICIVCSTSLFIIPRSNVAPIQPESRVLGFVMYPQHFSLGFFLRFCMPSSS